MKKTFFLLSFIGSLAVAPSVQACSPAQDWPPTIAENVARMDVAFIGTVENVSQQSGTFGRYEVTFSVDSTIKGSLENTVTVTAPVSSAACGYDDGEETFEEGSVWAMFANEEDGAYTTNSLSLNTSYKSVGAAAAAMAAAGAGDDDDDDEPMMCTKQYQPVCGKGPDGSVKTYGNSCTLTAEKGTLLYEGECEADVSAAPTRDLWQGMRGAEVTWLQNFLIAKLTSAAASSLATVGATGYFGNLTTAALAEYQRAYAITPARGYFGPKTRAFIATSEIPSDTATSRFTGKISAVDTGCFADGICSVTVDEKEIILLTGLRIGPIPPVGSLTGVESIGDLESEIGSTAEVYAAPTTEGGADYTLYGNTSYYVKVL